MGVAAAWKEERLLVAGVGGEVLLSSWETLRRQRPGQNRRVFKDRAGGSGVAAPIRGISRDSCSHPDFGILALKET